EPRWAELGEAVARELPWPFGFDEARHRVEVVGSAARATSGELWSSLRNHLRAVPEGGGLLVVTHGGFCELLLAGSGLSPAPLEALGPVRCLEGVRFELQAKVPCSAELLRLPDGATRV
ncbi:MAG TPA: hypothetical protein VGU43_00890, partial [Thermoplasmata archaeon]|nr:hypothetical protein [Thermoplasmata archaeon]